MVINNFDELFGIYDGSILSKIKFIELINSLKPKDIYDLTQSLDKKFKDNLKNKVMPAQSKVECFYHDFIKSTDKEMEFSFNQKNIFVLERITSNFSWDLDFDLKGTFSINDCKIRIDPELLAKQIKLKETSKLISRQEVNFLNKSNATVLSNIQYLLGLLDLIQESVNIDTVKLELDGKTEIIRITPTMFDQIFKIIFKEAGLRI
ncbi:hypothetical protein QR674_07855 [Acinetobacter chinensis]|uniref:DUF4403 family protein n=1 Tax=Acinetobacter chinensis TaxID=2004650 RepID=A0ABU3WFD3_9GAMM|nr:hypothetical protein [Acinetobacter chinensis]MDV2468896.1 hypothetical protein [Acinetobacter chinensis]